MAFRQSTFALPRQVTLPDSRENAPSVVPDNQQQAVDESQEWVLFPSHPTHSSSQTETSFAAWPSRTAGPSRLSDFGSFDTGARSGQPGEDVSSAVDDAAGEDEDLDSLDEGLHAFQEPSMYQSLQNLDQIRSILPAHDGLGTFPASSLPVQDQLWRFEQYNPRKRPIEQPNWSNVQRYLDAVDDKDNSRIDVERTERIEKWRLEQSKILLDEIERKTRKRGLGSDYSKSVSNHGREPTICGTDNAFNPDNQSRGIELGTGSVQMVDNESLWERITQRIIRDFLGIDDALLGVILGESLHVNSYPPPAGPSSTSSPRFLNDPVTSLPDTDWNTRCLDRLAREIGVLVQHLSKHPGAFSTLPDSTNFDYAGIPISPLIPPKAQSESPTSHDGSGTAPSASPCFKPTLQDHHPLRHTTTNSDTTHAALWGIEEEKSPSDTTAAKDREYWERTPNVRTIFRLLQHRFATPHQPPTSKPPPTIATTATPASLRRAAVIRQHHPLVSRPTPRRTNNRPSSSLLRSSRHHHYHHHHHNSSNPFHSFKRQSDGSCASLSVRQGKWAGSGSSRNYWDLGGSGAGGGGGAGGSASVVAVATGGGLGAWGEV